MDDDKDLDKLLMARYVPEAPDDLAQRIAAMSYERAQEKPWQRPSEMWSALKARLEEAFLLPQPALAVCVLVVLGFAGGFYGFAGLTQDERMGAAGELSSFMVISDSFVASQFLSEVES